MTEKEMKIMQLKAAVFDLNSEMELLNFRRNEILKEIMELQKKESGG